MTTYFSEDSENEIDEQTHARLIENVLNLDTQQHVKKPTRTEPALQVSEFNLVKSITGSKGAVRLQDLTKPLNKRVQISDKVQKTELKSQTLRKPLEKPLAERIRRTIAYTKATLSLDRWEPIITANRAAANLSFPLNTDTNLKYNPDVNTGWRLKSKLEQEVEKIDPSIETYEVETDDKFPLTMEEMMERRKEFAKLRRHQGYKEAKSRMQNKIKSKKYRRILRREKIKQQMKEFELLQKTNPEEALKKLEEIEKARAEERVSLRHKSTGKWARNQQVRAKYDKESRKVLAQQLAMSKDLTQKIQIHDSSDSEKEDEELTPSAKTTNKDNSNPWTKTIEPSAEIKDFISGYRKFWEYKSQEEENSTTQTKIEDLKIPAESEVQEDNNVYAANNDLNKQTSVKINEANKKEIKKHQTKIEDLKIPAKSDVREDKNVPAFNDDSNKQTSAKINGKNKSEIKKNETKRRKRKKLVELSPFGEWDVSIIDKNSERFIDDVFDDLEYKLKNKTNKRFKEVLKNKLPFKDGKKSNALRKSKAKKVDLSLPKQVKKVVINEKLIEKDGSNDDVAKANDFNVLKSIIESEETKLNETAVPNITPTVNPVNLSTELPDVLTLDENEEESEQRGIIAEAFEDDDIIDEFTKDKQNEIEKDTPQDVNLFLPGWGDWGGANIKPSRRKLKRFILKFPKEMPRKDKNKGDLIVSEKANKKMKPHLVSDLPFPFKSVKEFEASVRAPIGNTFVTETAFKKLIRPAVTTKLGTVIRPMSEDVLLKQNRQVKKRKRT